MSELDKTQKAIVGLIKRSQKDKDGWCKTGENLYCMIVDLMPRELIETSEEEGVRFIRFTERGQAVADYL